VGDVHPPSQVLQAGEINSVFLFDDEGFVRLPTVAGGVEGNCEVVTFLFDVGDFEVPIAGVLAFAEEEITECDFNVSEVHFLSFVVVVVDSITIYYKVSGVHLNFERFGEVLGGCRIAGNNYFIEKLREAQGLAEPLSF
jgi:hypothetical protein